MSRAFVKEPDGSEPIDDLPELPISPERNLVTPRGLALIDQQLSQLGASLAAAQEAGDKAAIARTARDLRYWQARRATAERIVPQATDQVRFGLSVTLQAVEDDRIKIFRIVGQDEADATHGLLSYTSPLATQLLGKMVGDHVGIGPAAFEITKISLEG